MIYHVLFYNIKLCIWFIIFHIAYHVLNLCWWLTMKVKRKSILIVALTYTMSLLIYEFTSWYTRRCRVIKVKKMFICTPSSLVVIRCHPLSPAVPRQHPLSLGVTCYRPLSRVTTLSHPASPVLTRRHPFSPVVTRHYSSSPVTTRCHPSLLVVTRYHPSQSVSHWELLIDTKHDLFYFNLAKSWFEGSEMG